MNSTTQNTIVTLRQASALMRACVILGIFSLSACRPSMNRAKDQPLILYPEGAAHPVFDLKRLQEVWQQHEDQPWGSAEDISTIWDLRAMEAARRECGVIIGEGVPTDVFIMVPGEPRNLAGTKVGGRPFWPKGKPWPVSEGGEPHEFLAQFNFLDSKDIYPDLPGDILVVTIDRHGQMIPELVPGCWWLSADEMPDPELEVASFEGAPAMHGVRYRGMDYPAAVPMVDALEGDRNVACWRTPAYNATKIGGLAVGVQSGMGSEADCLAQLISLQLYPGLPFSPPNRAEGFPDDPEALG
ncbi:MAG: DUF1963 domain-containing protein, partial [Planctomycetota bacterium]